MLVIFDLEKKKKTYPVPTLFGKSKILISSYTVTKRDPTNSHDNLTFQVQVVFLVRVFSRPCFKLLPKSVLANFNDPGSIPSIFR